jgi:hypothetical protein
MIVSSEYIHGVSNGLLIWVYNLDHKHVTKSLLISLHKWFGRWIDNLNTIDRKFFIAIRIPNI